MEYLKLFSTENDYLTYRDGSDYLKPNVSLSDRNSTVYYNYSPPPKTNGFEYVDLWLPSGTLWATMNVGASNPTDFGLYFQWGDTVGYTADKVGTGEGKKAFAWSDYKWNPSGDGKTFTKYESEGATLELADDAANANMGGDWHMPSPDQIKELINNTTNTRTTSDDGVNGRLFTSKNGKSIFMPAAGYVLGGSVNNRGVYGCVWSSMLSAGSVDRGQHLNLSSDGAILNNGGGRRFGGFSVRGVLG